MSSCSVCNTELLDNLICCAGRCKKFFHYTCVGFSRTIFDGYKKVSGLQWQCTNCIDHLDRIWIKLEELTTLVNDIKSTINLCGIVKSAINESISDGFTRLATAVGVPSTQSINQHDSNKKRTKRQRKQMRKSNGNHVSISSTHRHSIVPFRLNESANVNANVTLIDTAAELIQPTDVSDDNLNSTVINRQTDNNQSVADQLNSTVIEHPAEVTAPTNTNYEIRVADKRSYLWLSGFHHTSTVPQVVRLVSKVLGINEGDVICRSLKSARRKYNDFHYISFRIGIRSSNVESALQPNKWPEGVTCKCFNQKN